MTTHDTYVESQVFFFNLKSQRQGLFHQVKDWILRKFEDYEKDLSMMSCFNNNCGSLRILNVFFTLSCICRDLRIEGYQIQDL